LIEIHEQPWCPRSIRDGATDCLRVVAGLGRQYHNILPRLHQAVQASHSERIVDLCSGGGGPWFSLVNHLNRLNGQPIEVLLTDLYPNQRLIQGRGPALNNLAFFPTSVDATRVPATLPGFRTLFTAFHHFPPPIARAILQHAVTQGQGIGIFEQTRRHSLALLVMLTLPLIAWLATPFIRPFCWSRLFWTYLIPVIPAVICFDGCVSCLRTYSPAELRELVAGLDGPAYVWDIGWTPSPLSPIGITYLIGYPVSRK
jgi:hypothetical protein